MRGYAVDRVDVAGLIERQRRLAMLSALILIVPLFSIPAAFALFPDLAAARPFGVPSLAWIVLSPGVFPLFVVLGRWHERRADRIESEWMDEHP